MGVSAVVESWLFFALFAIVPAVSAVLLHRWLRKLKPPEELKRTHEVAGFLVAVVGVLYGVVLGFVVVTVWTSFDAAQRNADTEAGAVLDTYALSDALPEPWRSRMQIALAGYAVEVRDHEFASLAHGKADPVARRKLYDALLTVESMHVRQGAGLERALQFESLRQALIRSFTTLGDSRRVRLLNAVTGEPPVLYATLVAGGLMLLTFVFLFGVESFQLQAIMTGLVAGSVGLLFGLVVALGSPYSGILRVSPEAWTAVIEAGEFLDRAKDVPPQSSS